MAPWPLTGHSLRRRAPAHFVRIGKQADFSSRRWRLHLLHQDDTIDSAAHELVAFTCRRFETRSVNLDRAASIGSDCAGIAKLGDDVGHRRSPHAEEFRKRLLGQWQDVSVSPI